AQGHPCLKRSGGRGAGTGIPSAQAQAQREAPPAHAETQEHWLEISTPLLAVPRGRPRRDPPCARVGLLLSGPRQGKRRSLLMQPRGRAGIALQGVQRQSTKHAVESPGKPRLQALPQSVSLESGPREAGG